MLKDRTGKKGIYIHLGYWMFYVLFFTVQRFSYYGYKDFWPVLLLNLSYLPGVILFTYIITDVFIPKYFITRKIGYLLWMCVLALVIYPVVVYFERTYVVEPYVFNDQIPYSLYNFLTAGIILIFGTFPVAVYKIARLFGQESIKQKVIEKQKIEAELRMKVAELKLLRAQVHPHFLFNALNSIQALIYIDVTKADKMLSDLSEILRASLTTRDRLTVPLSEELNLISKYLSMEKIRFPHRLNYFIQASQRARDQEVVTFLLQPFVENAIKYGLQRNPDSLVIEVQADVIDNTLILKVQNNGAWIESRSDTGTGIKNVKDRLKFVYPDRHEFEIIKTGEEVIVSIKITLNHV